MPDWSDSGSCKLLDDITAVSLRLVDEEDTDLVLKLRPEVKRCVEQELNEQLQYARRHLDLLLEECRCIAL